MTDQTTTTLTTEITSSVVGTEVPEMTEEGRTATILDPALQLR